MHARTAAFLGCLLLAIVASAKAQERTAVRGSLLSVEQMTADLDGLVARVRSVHPATVEGLPGELSRAIERARGELSAPLDLHRFWVVLSRVLCALHDAHSNVSLPPSGKRLGISLRWTGEGIIVAADSGPLRKGDRLVRLATRTEAELLDLLRDVIPAENDYWVRHQGETMLTDPGLLRALGIADEVPVPLTVERDGEQLRVLVPAAEARRSSQPAPWVRFEIDEEQRLGLFVLDRCTNNKLYRSTLQRFFSEVREKGITRIAIDVRRNGGGSSSVINELLPYLDVENYVGFGSVVRWSPEVRAAGVRRGNFGALFAAGTQRNPPREVQNARVEEPFGGEVFILTSAATFSSGHWFAVIFQDNRIGRVLGEPTGNAPSSAGDQLRFSLTHSGLSYGLSHKQWQRPDPDRDPAEALVPDRIIPTTRRHVAEGRDAVLEHLRKTR